MVQSNEGQTIDLSGLMDLVHEVLQSLVADEPASLEARMALARHRESRLHLDYHFMGQMQAKEEEPTKPTLFVPKDHDRPTPVTFGG